MVVAPFKAVFTVRLNGPFKRGDQLGNPGLEAVAGPKCTVQGLSAGAAFVGHPLRLLR